jgi:hypothetical protein
VLDRRTCADIVVAATPIAAIISSVIVIGGVVITIGSVVGVPTIVFIRRPGAQETPYRQVLLSRRIIFLLFQGGVIPIPRLVIVILVFQFPVEKELEILAIGQGLIIL